MLLREFWTGVGAVIFMGAFLSGIYPAFVLSSFNPITALKGKASRYSKGFHLRKALVVFQFAVSIVIIATTLIVYRQLSFMRNTDLGMNIDQTLVLKTPRINDFASYTASRRTKEIGIRKVVGATVPNILTMLTKDFAKWVLFANLIAWPVAYFAVTKWLQSFAYRINISWWIFVLAGALTLLIAILSVSWQAIRAATANPIEALRYE
jgi:ABC-type antimicrobial peptide transport system permease subunit